VVPTPGSTNKADRAQECRPRPAVEGPPIDRPPPRAEDIKALSGSGAVGERTANSARVSIAARSVQPTAALVVSCHMNIEARVAARLQIVDEHIRQENDHDLAGIMGTFGKTARFDDEPFNAHHVGRRPRILRQLVASAPRAQA
jgi:hypothetical protein